MARSKIAADLVCETQTSEVPSTSTAPSGATWKCLRKKNTEVFCRTSEKISHSQTAETNLGVNSFLWELGTGNLEFRELSPA